MTIDRLEQLTKNMLDIHNELETYKTPPLSGLDRTMLSLKLQSLVTEHNDWICSIRELIQVRQE